MIRELFQNGIERMFEEIPKNVDTHSHRRICSQPVTETGPRHEWADMIDDAYKDDSKFTIDAFRATHPADLADPESADRSPQEQLVFEPFETNHQMSSGRFRRRHTDF
jgi:hypothetical protein